MTFFLINREKAATLITLTSINESFSLMKIMNTNSYFLNALTICFVFFSKKIEISKTDCSITIKISIIIFSKLILILFFINHETLKTIDQ